MTNNTIPNVPRELLDRCCKRMYDMMQGDLHEELRALLSAPSPAGVDGCKCSMSISMLGDGCRHCQHQEYIDRLGEMLDEERSELSDAQAIIDVLRGEVGAQRVKTCTALKERNDAREERDAALVECERRRMQLAACGVVALANTIESAGEARQMHPDYMSASCSDVAGAVDREIALRTERDQHAQRIGELETALEFACKSLAQVTSSDGSGHADIAVSVLRMAGRKEIDASQIVEAYKAGAKWRIDAALSSGKKGE